MALTVHRGGGWYASQSQLDMAERDYIEVEKDLSDDPRRQVVLVSANSIQALKAAYPDYYEI